MAKTWNALLYAPPPDTVPRSAVGSASLRDFETWQARLPSGTSLTWTGGTRTVGIALPLVNSRKEEAYDRHGRAVAAIPLKRIPNFMNTLAGKWCFRLASSDLLVPALSFDWNRAARGFARVGKQARKYVVISWSDMVPGRISPPVRRSHFWTTVNHDWSQP